MLSFKTEEMVSAIKFLFLVCLSDHYKDDIKSVFDRLAKRYEDYTEKAAEDKYIYPQIRLVKEEIKSLKGDAIK